MIDHQTRLDAKSGPGRSASPAKWIDRRRPGRVQDVSPELLPLLRGETIPDQERGSIDDQDVERSQLSAVTGILAGVALSVPLWGIVLWAGSLMFR